MVVAYSFVFFKHYGGEKSLVFWCDKSTEEKKVQNWLKGVWMKFATGSGVNEFSTQFQFGFGWGRLYISKVASWVWFHVVRAQHIGKCFSFISVSILDVAHILLFSPTTAVLELNWKAPYIYMYRYVLEEGPPVGKHVRAFVFKPFYEQALCLHFLLLKILFFGRKTCNFWALFPV